MKLLITGGFGFIGSTLIRHILDTTNFEIINIDSKTSTSMPESLNTYENLKRYKYENVNICNYNKINSIFYDYQPDSIFHLAAETHVDTSILEPAKFLNTNIIGTYNLLKLLNKKIKIIHISTDEVFGEAKNSKFSENSKYDPKSPYSATKASADHLVKAYGRTYKVSAIISNCCNNYGPNQFPEKLIPKLIYNIINNNPLPIYGKGKNSREWIHVYDHCEALLLIFLKGKIGENYNIGSGQNYKNIDIAKKLLKIVKKKSLKIKKNVRITFVKDRPGHDIRYALNNKKILKKLKWKSKISLNEGLLNTFNWYNNNKSFFSKTSIKQFDKRLGLKI